MSVPNSTTDKPCKSGNDALVVHVGPITTIPHPSHITTSTATTTHPELKVAFQPLNMMGLNNRVYVSSPSNHDNEKKDIKQPRKYVMINQEYVFVIDTHLLMKSDEMGLNQMQRKTCKVEHGDKIKVMPYLPTPDEELKTLRIECELVRNDHYRIGFDEDQMRRLFLDDYQGHVFSMGQYLYAKFGDYTFIYRVQNMMTLGHDKKSKPRGVVTPQTRIKFVVSETQKRNIDILESKK
jgi:hypothetical protein